MKQEKIYNDTLTKLLRSVFSLGYTLGKNGLDEKEGWETAEKIIREEGKNGD